MYITPNIVAYLALIIWPFVVLILTSTRPAKRVVLLATVLSSLLLPAALDIDLPSLPPLNKANVNALALVIFLFLSGNKFRIFQPGKVTKLIIGYFVVIVISVWLNGMPIISGKKFLPGLTAYDAFSSIVRMMLFLIPYFLGRFFLSKVTDNESTFKFIAYCCLIYSLPMLFEVLMSPQLHRLVYGYHASNFIQQMRSGGFRPVVFLGHGLGLAFWFATGLLTVFALNKNKIKFSSLPNKVAIVFLVFVLFLCKTWSAVLYAVIGFSLIYKLIPEKQIKWSLLFALLVLLYPVSKIINIFPDKAIVSAIEQYSPERAESLEFRFMNEEVLLNHARKQPYFGWAGWGRNRVYSNYDGRDDTVTDGKWIIELGTNGSLGFLLYYAILIAPLYYANKAVKYINEPKEKIYFATLAIILSISIIDSIPNNGMGAMHLLLAGALLGQSEALLKTKKDSRNNFNEQAHT